MSNTSAVSPNLQLAEALKLNAEALKLNAEANRINAQTIAHLATIVPNLSPNPLDPQDRVSQVVQALKINAEATLVSAQALIAHLTYNGPKPSETSTPDSQTPLPPPPTPAAKPVKFVINERVGSITTAEWDALVSTGRIDSLVVVLHGITDELTRPSITWVQMGEIVRSKLVGFGFRFAGPGEIVISSDWALVRAKGNDKKATAAALLDCSRDAISSHWYTNEMLRVWRRLIDITDA